MQPRELSLDRVVGESSYDFRTAISRISRRAVDHTDLIRGSIGMTQIFDRSVDGSADRRHTGVARRDLCNQRRRGSSVVFLIGASRQRECSREQQDTR